MAIKESINEQLLIVYDDKVDSSKHIYTTAYCKEQANKALMQCLERFGRDTHARIVPAREMGII